MKRTIILLYLISRTLFANGQFVEFVHQNTGVIEGIEYPDCFLYSNDHRFLYIKSNLTLSVNDYDSASGKFEPIQLIRSSQLDIWRFNAITLNSEGNILYVITGHNDQFESKIIIYDRDVNSGILTRVNEISSYPSDVLLKARKMTLDPNNKFLYVFGRAHMFVFEVQGNNLSYINKHHIRDHSDSWMSPDGNYLYINRSGYIRQYGVNQSTGNITLLEEYWDIDQIGVTIDGINFFGNWGGGLSVTRRDESSGALSLIKTNPSPTNLICKISGDNEFLHAMSGRTGDIYTYTIDITTGTLSALDTLKGRDDFFNGPLGFHKSPNSDFMYIPGFNYDDLALGIYKEGPHGLVSLVDSLRIGISLNKGLNDIDFSFVDQNDNLYLISNSDSSIVKYSVDKTSGIGIVKDRWLFSELEDDLRIVGATVDNTLKHMYAVDETSNSILIFDLVDEISLISTIGHPPVEVPNTWWSTELLVSTDGKYVYEKINYSSIHVYERSIETGALSLIQTVTDIGGTPLSRFSGIVISNDNKNLYTKGFLGDNRNPTKFYIAVLDIDQTTGLLTLNDLSFKVVCSGCTKFVISPDDKTVIHFGKYGITALSRNQDDGRLSYLQLSPLGALKAPQYDGIVDVTFPKNNRYIAVHTIDGLVMYQRDFDGNGKLIYNGEQEIFRGYGYTFYFSAYKQRFLYDSDGKTIYSICERDGGVWVYNFESNFPPAAPSNFKAIYNKDKEFYTLSWDRNIEGNISKYEIYRGSYSDPLSAKKILETSDTSKILYQDNSIYRNHYWVKAVNDLGQSSPFSDGVGPIGLDPKKLDSVRISTGDKYLSIEWEENTEEVFLQYVIFRNTNNDFETSLRLSWTKENSFKDYDVSYDSTYYYWIAVEDIGGNLSDMSDVVYGVPINRPPSAPQHVQSQAGENFISLNWEENKEADFVEFVLFKNLTNDTLSAELLLRTIKNSYLDEDVVGGTEYYYWVKAFDGVSHSKFSITASNVPYNSPPSSPQNLTVKNISDLVTLTWDQNVEEDFKNYKVYEGTVNNVESLSLIATVENNSYEFRPENTSVENFYAVKAVDSAGLESDFSSVVSFTIETILSTADNINQHVVIFPNPAKDILNVKTVDKVYDRLGFEIYNAYGIKVLNGVCEGQIDISSLVPGNYFLLLNFEGDIVKYRMSIN
ncbi:MAG: beta-propeller fold lactonase family protein [Bacteroidota bacterium]